MRRLIVIIVGIVAVTGLVFGCGGSDDETGAEATTSAESTVPDSLTKAQFIKEADRICQRVVLERGADAEAWRKELPGGPAEAEERLDDGFKEIVGPWMQKQTEKLEALPVPAGDEAAVDRVIEKLAEAATLLTEEGIKGLRRPVVSDFKREARAYGLKFCSRFI